MAKLTITHPEHGELEVELPEGYVAPDELKRDYMPKAIFQTELGNRVQSIIRGEGYVKPDSLLEDEDFRTKALEKWQVKVAPDEAAAAKARADAIEAAKQTWTAQHLTPVQQKLQKAEATVQQLLRRDLFNQIATSAVDVGVLDTLRKSPVAGQPAPIVHMLAEYFGFDDKSGMWAVKKANEDGSDGFAYSAKPTDNRPYQSVAEFMSAWAEDEANKQFLADTRQRGPGIKPGDSGERRGGVVQLSFEDSQDAQKYRAAQEKAAKIGAEIEITDRPY